MKIRKITLASVITDIAAGPFGSNLKVSCFVPTGCPIIDGANLKGYKVTDNITKFVTNEKALSLHRSIAHRGDVVVTISGTLGQISYVPNDSAYEEYLCSQRQFRVTFDSKQVYVPYLVFYFHTYEGQHKILSFANQVGVPALAQPLKNFRNIEIDLPDLATQKEIAQIIESLNDKIELNQKINHHLEQMAQAIFKSWFVDFEPFGGTMPSDWRNGTLSGIAPNIYSGGTPNTSKKSYWNGEIPWLSSGETRNHFIISTEKQITQNGVNNSSTKLAHRFDVVMASAGQGLTRGQTSLLLFDSYINQSVIVMHGNSPFYLFLNLLTRYEELRAISDSSSIRGSITTKMLAQFPMLLPSPNALADFSNTIKPLFGQIENNLRENARLAELRDTLLPRLMSGELSVADLDGGK